jgi:C4-dicarboxylate transporter DctM subunit
VPLAALLRRVTSGASWAGGFVLAQDFTFLLAFLGAIVATRERRMIAIGAEELWRGRSWARILEQGARLGALVLAGVLAVAAWGYFRFQREVGASAVSLTLVGVMVAAFLGSGLHLALDEGRPGARFARVAALAAGITVALWFERTIEATGTSALASVPGWAIALAFGALALAGTPLYLVLGGLTVVLFWSTGVSAQAVAIPMESLALSSYLPAIPLFTLTGVLLAQGDLPTRLFDLFRAGFGWVPGGTAVISALLCAFLSAFTGGSGVTILALGGLLFPALVKQGYPERFALGLITASGSLGILLPPALPLILFGIAAEVPIDELFRAGILPGLLFVGLVVGWCVVVGIRSRVPREPFEAAALGRGLRRAAPELALPLVTLGAFFSGWATLVETAAVTCAYAFVLQVLVRRNVRLPHDLPRIASECVVLLGGVLVLLCAAKGLSSYVVDAQIPAQLVEWMKASVSSPAMFLLILNLCLLVVGCFLDIYSATFVVVPLIVELARGYGISPVHLGIVFIANLELGFLTPPVGLNLFLASQRFDRSLLSVARAALAPLLLLAVGVLVVTYFPALTRL